jgi:hypothetical protein
VAVATNGLERAVDLGDVERASRRSSAPWSCSARSATR